jgi:hypothetical protein
MNPCVCFAAQDSSVDFTAENADCAHAIEWGGQILITT